jgi:DNA-binding transcriptional ArsR family regulator
METKQAELFKILGVDSRIRIIELLKQRGPLGVNEMSKSLGITPSAVSQHLKILKHAGLVRNERSVPAAVREPGGFLKRSLMGPRIRLIFCRNMKRNLRKSFRE